VRAPLFRILLFPFRPFTLRRSFRKEDEMIILELLAIAILARYVQAATSTFKWDMSYVTAAPDGVSRPVIGVNGQWPPCPIVVSKGDQVVIEAKNDLNDGEFVTLHTHGVFQNGSNYMDGVDQVTQW